MDRDRSELVVERTGPLTTVQDGGRPGQSALGVSTSGALDRAAYALANRLVGNREGAAALEVTLGGLQLRTRGTLTMGVTGAAAPVTVDGRGVDTHRAVAVPDGATVALAAPRAGLRSYVAVRGGVQSTAVLGSRSTDVLAGLGEPVGAGDVLPVGPTPSASVPPVDVAPVAALPEGDVDLRVILGPRDDWFTAAALDLLRQEPFVVAGDSNRVGMRLDGPALTRARDDELPSEGTVPGALQVPTRGQPVLFLADHPVTGGYPVVAVVEEEDLPRAAQARPGQRLRFRTIRRDPL